MAALEVIALDTSVPQLMAPQAGDTYTFPRAVEMPLGTANGVLFLDGSKVVTSGSALTFDGTNLLLSTGDVLLNNAKYYYGKSSAGSNVRLLGINAGNVAYVGPIDSGPVSAIVNASTSVATTAFYASGAEGMRLTSTGLGIGTNNPSQKLTVSGSAAFSGIGFNANAIDTVSTAQSFARFQTTGGDFYIGTEGSVGGVFFPSSTAYAAVLYNASSTPMQFYTAGTLRATLDSSGNLGIGTGNPAAKLHLYNASDAGALILENGTNGGVYARWKRPNREYYLALDINNNGDTEFSLYDATAAATRWTVDASGNLGLGVTPSAWSTYKVLQVGAQTAIANSGAFSVYGTNWYYDGADKYVTTGNATQYYQNAGTHVWFTAPSGTAGDPISFTQSMTLDASGNLLVGGTSALGSAASRGNITVNGATDAILSFGNAASLAGYILQDSGGMTLFSSGATYQRFYTNNTERARITSAGVFVVGDTAAVASSLSGVKFNGGLYNGLGLNDSSATSGAGYIYFQSNGTTIGSITRVAATSAVAYNTTSDQRLKENIQDAASASDLIDAIQVRQYNWKSDGSHQRYGFIAQELVDIAPEAVHQPTDSDEMMGVDYSKLVPMLVKEIQSLRQRLAAAGI
jgi:hypothetical protein